MSEAHSLNPTEPVDPQPFGFSLNVARCSGCMACMVACMDENDLPGDRCYRQVVRHEEVSGETPIIRFFSMACFHCGDAPCLTVCPTGALHKRNGDEIVRVDQDLCIGCHSCLAVCPYGAPQFLADGHMHKCHLCHHRLGQQLEPACVRACPTRALEFGTLAELSRKRAHSAGKQILTAALDTSPDIHLST